MDRTGKDVRYGGSLSEETDPSGPTHSVTQTLLCGYPSSHVCAGSSYDRPPFSSPSQWDRPRVGSHLLVLSRSFIDWNDQIERPGLLGRKGEQSTWPRFTSRSMSKRVMWSVKVTGTKSTVPYEVLSRTWSSDGLSHLWFSSGLYGRLLHWGTVRGVGSRSLFL